MHRAAWVSIVTGIVVAATGVVIWIAWPQPEDQTFLDQFPVDRGALSATGRNPFFILEPGYRLSYEGGGDELVITVLDETELIDGVSTRVVEERETQGGALAEVSRNYYAIDPLAKDVYYFGEDVDNYSAGRIVGHSGVWRSGAAGAHFGLMMPGDPRIGVKHYQEIAPDVAMDRAEVVSADESIRVPAGSLDGVLKVRETTPLEPVVEDKYYAPGIGLVVDAGLLLVHYGPIG
jgi:hypothetical protein